MQRCSKAVPLLLVILMLGVALPAFADDFAELEKGRNSYDAGRYGEAAERFRATLDPASDKRIREPALVERARIYLAASLIALGRDAEADREVEAVLRQNQSAQPDSVFPTQVFDRFTDVRARLKEALEAVARQKAAAEQQKKRLEDEARQRESARVQRLEAAARQEVHLVHRSRWVAMIPFGAGQFQNDQPALGWTLLGTEAALAGVSIASASILASLQAQGTRPNVDVPALNSRIHIWKQLNNLTFAGFALAATAGIVHAQLSYDPSQRIVKQRPLPKDLEVAPSATVAREGFLVGVQGAF